VGFLRRPVLPAVLLLLLLILPSFHTAVVPGDWSVAWAGQSAFLPPAGDSRAEIERFVDRVVDSLIRKHRFFLEDKAGKAVAGLLAQLDVQQGHGILVARDMTKFARFELELGEDSGFQNLKVNVVLDRLRGARSETPC
jgi:hypothetical protein